MNPASSFVKSLSFARAGLVLALATALACVGRAAEPVKPPSSAALTSVRNLTISPAPMPRPALKYHLLPPATKRTPGNAAPLYLQAFLQLSDDRSEAMRKITEASIEFPAAEPAREDLRKALGQLSHIVQLLEEASRRERCDWDPPTSLPAGVDIAVTLPMIQMARAAARLLTVKASLEIADRQYDRALGTIQIGLALGQAMNEKPMLVNGLVAVAIDGIILDAADSLIGSPAAPNLYWALSELPDPLIDFRRTVQAEADELYEFVPWLRDVKTAQHTPEQWEQTLKEVLTRASDLVEGPQPEVKVPAPPSKPTGSKEATEDAAEGPRPIDPKASLEKAYPTARRRMIERGWTEKRVEATPRIQLVLIEIVETYEEARDDAIKSYYLPYNSHDEENQHLRVRTTKDELLPLASTLVPAFRRCRAAEVQQQRQVAALRCVEAIRSYAASHQGQLPERLDQISEVPVPINAMTGKPFPYKREETTAILDVDGPSYSAPFQYRLTVRK